MQHETDLKTLEILKIAIQREDLSSNERDNYIAQVIKIQPKGILNTKNI